jgi:hypothetical protein
MQVIQVSDVRTAKDGRNFFVVTFRPSFGQKPVNRTFWEQYKTDSKTGVRTQEKYWERATPEEAHILLKSKEPVDAKKITRTVEEYTIGENTVNKYSTVMFPDEDEITLFQQQNHPIVDELTGEVYKRPERRKATLAPSDTSVSTSGLPFSEEAVTDTEAKEDF